MDTIDVCCVSPDTEFPNTTTLPSVATLGACVIRKYRIPITTRTPRIVKMSIITYLETNPLGPNRRAFTFCDFSLGCTTVPAGVKIMSNISS